MLLHFAGRISRQREHLIAKSTATHSQRNQCSTPSYHTRSRAKKILYRGNRNATNTQGSERKKKCECEKGRIDASWDSVLCAVDTQTKGRSSERRWRCEQNCVINPTTITYRRNYRYKTPVIINCALWVCVCERDVRRFWPEWGKLNALRRVVRIPVCGTRRAPRRRQQITIQRE